MSFIRRWRRKNTRSGFFSRQRRRRAGEPLPKEEIDELTEKIAKIEANEFAKFENNFDAELDAEYKKSEIV